MLLTSIAAAKLADVGVSRLQTRTFLSDLSNIVGTYAWVAPEILMGGRQCTQAVDIYSYGGARREGAVTREATPPSLIDPPPDTTPASPLLNPDLQSCCGRS